MTINAADEMITRLYKEAMTNDHEEDDTDESSSIISIKVSNATVISLPPKQWKSEIFPSFPKLKTTIGVVRRPAHTTRQDGSGSHYHTIRGFRNQQRNQQLWRDTRPTASCRVNNEQRRAATANVVVFGSTSHQH